MNRVDMSAIDVPKSPSGMSGASAALRAFYTSLLRIEARVRCTLSGEFVRAPTINRR
jgi:hypothetical protein